MFLLLLLLPELPSKIILNALDDGPEVITRKKLFSCIDYGSLLLILHFLCEVSTSHIIETKCKLEIHHFSLGFFSSLSFHLLVKKLFLSSTWISFQYPVTASCYCFKETVHILSQYVIFQYLFQSISYAIDKEDILETKFF